MNAIDPILVAQINNLYPIKSIKHLIPNPNQEHPYSKLNTLNNILCKQQTISTYISISNKELTSCLTSTIYQQITLSLIHLHSRYNSLDIFCITSVAQLSQCETCDFLALKKTI